MSDNRYTTWNHFNKLVNPETSKAQGAIHLCTPGILVFQFPVTERMENFTFPSVAE